MPGANGTVRVKYGLPSESGATSSTQEQSKGSGSPKRKLSEPDITSGITFDVKPVNWSQPAPAAPKAAPLFGKFGLGPTASPGKKPHFSFAAPPPGTAAEASSPRQLFSFGQQAPSSRLAQSGTQPPAPGGDALPGSRLAAAANRFTQQFAAQQPVPAAPVSSGNHAQHDSLAKAAQAFDKQVGGPEPANNRAQQAQPSSQPWPGAQAGTNSRAEEGTPRHVRYQGNVEQERPGRAGSSGERAASGPPLPDGSAGFASGKASGGAGPFSPQIPTGPQVGRAGRGRATTPAATPGLRVAAAAADTPWRETSPMDCSPYSAVQTPFTASRPSPATDARRSSQQGGNGQPRFGGLRSSAATSSRRDRRSTPRESGGTVYQSVDDFESPDKYESDPSDVSDDDEVTSGWHGNDAGAAAGATAMAAFPRPGHSKADTQLPQKFESKLHIGAEQGRGTSSPAVPGLADPEKETVADGIATDFAGVHPFASPSRAQQSSFAQMFASKAKIKSSPASKQRRSRASRRPAVPTAPAPEAAAAGRPPSKANQPAAPEANAAAWAAAFSFPAAAARDLQGTEGTAGAQGKQAEQVGDAQPAPAVSQQPRGASEAFFKFGSFSARNAAEGTDAAADQEASRTAHVDAMEARRTAGPEAVAGKDTSTGQAGSNAQTGPTASFSFRRPAPNAQLQSKPLFTFGLAKAAANDAAKPASVGEPAAHGIAPLPATASAKAAQPRSKAANLHQPVAVTAVPVEAAAPDRAASSAGASTTASRPVVSAVHGPATGEGATAFQTQRPSTSGGRPGFVFGFAPAQAARPPSPVPEVNSASQQKPGTDAAQGLSGKSGKRAQGAARARKARASPGKGKAARQQPTLMNGQPLYKGAQRSEGAPPQPEPPTGAADKGQKWTAFAAEIRAGRERDQSAFRTPEPAARPASPGPVPMSGVAFSGPGFAASPNPSDLPEPDKSFFGSGEPSASSAQAQPAAPVFPAEPMSKVPPLFAADLPQPKAPGQGRSEPTTAPHASSVPTPTWIFGASAANNPFVAGEADTTSRPWGQPAQAMANLFRGAAAQLFQGASVQPQQAAAATASQPSASQGSRQQDGAAGSNPFTGWSQPATNGSAPPAPAQPVVGSGGPANGGVGSGAAAKAPFLSMTPGARSGGAAGRSAPNKGRRKGPPVKTAPHAEAAPGHPLTPREQALVAARETADRLRKRANECHTRQDYSRASNLYKEAVNCLTEAGLKEETAVLYNNLAATYIQRGRPVAALHYCEQAIKVDPTLLKAHVRAGNAHWRLGEYAAAAAEYTAACNRPGAPPEAGERLRELQTFQVAVQKAVEDSQAASTKDSVLKSLEEGPQQLLREAPASQPLLSLQAHSLIRLNRLAEAVQLAERHTQPSEGRPAPTWPWWIKAQAAFLQGDLGKAASMVERAVAHAQAGPEQARVLSINGGSQLAPEELQSAAVAMKELLRHKEAGNRAQKESRYDAALESYSAALAACANAPPAFAAVLHANRAAAHQAQGNFADAIADSLRAKALEPTYAKAHSRLASLLIDCKLYDAAQAALNELLSILPMGDPGRSDVNRRTAEAKLGIRKKQAANHYKLLGLARNCPPDEVRRVYKKLALKFHPDKALSNCKFATAITPSAAQLASQTEIEEAIRDKANQLFQLIGAAHGVLSNSMTRRQLDADLAFEEKRASSSAWGVHRPAGGASYQSPGYARSSYSFRQSNDFADDYSYYYHQTRSDEDDGFVNDFARRYNFPRS